MRRPASSTLPPAFLERLRTIIPAPHWDDVLRTFEEPKPTTFRVNTLKAQPREIRQALESQGLRVEPVAWCPEAFIVREGRLAALQETTSYRRGEIYIQSLSSLLPALVLDPRPGEHVLDLAAAPGSKTTQMACLMRNQGRLVANDNNRIRFYKLRANLQRQGIADVTLTLRRGETFGRSDPNGFDRVLVDAPCGTEGRFFTGRASSYNYWKVRKIHEMVGKQRRLLRAGLEALRPDGVLVYSTCTFAPEENEGVVAWALMTLEGAVALEPVALPVANTMPGLSAWDGRAFHPDVCRTVRVMPTREMEGFFLAKFRKEG
jgi:16S rRNA (cytosine1407-C5)-methyltransferase